MTIIKITATPCEFTGEEPMRRLRWMLSAKPIATQTIPVKTCADIERQRRALVDEVSAVYAGSFFVSELIVQGRVPNGYKAMRDRVEVDRCPGCAQEAA
jgi:hypothetical protein